MGTIDGFRWSLGTLYFDPLDAPAFTAGVMEGRVAQAVTGLMNDPSLRVSATFDVVESYLPGDQTRARVSRVLTDIRPLGEQAAIPYDGPPTALPSPPKALPPDSGS